MNGILLVDKPKDLTSHDIVAKIRKNFSLKKVGHGGTLDPFATGLLVVMIGKATKMSSSFLNDSKTYKGTIIFGKETDTYDVKGRVVNETKNVNFSEEDLKIAFSSFEGDIEQQPPPFSAIRINGQRAYDLARKGKSVELKKRTVKVFYFKLGKIIRNGDIKARFTAKVSKGTYIRSLAHDVGKKLKIGAYLSELRRTSSGKFLLSNAFKLEDILQWSQKELSLKMISYDKV